MAAGTVSVLTLGCAKNQVDSEVIGARMEAAGWTWIDDPHAADLIVVNTCSFIADARDESIDTVLAAVDSRPPSGVILTGCLAQRYGSALADELPQLAAVYGNREPGRVAELLDRLAAESGEGPVVWLPAGEPRLSGEARSRLLSTPGSAYLKLAEGCDHACTFCAIPSIRGRLRVRDRASVVCEFRELRSRGIHEFNLVAQDLAAWYDEAATDGSARRARDGEPGIVSLIEDLLAEPGEFWLRLLYLYPDRFPRPLATQAAADRRLLPYFDLSFQHADPAVLRAMGRPGDVSRYLDLVAGLRERNPDVILRSSFIVGFPGETPAAFDRLLRFLAEAELEWVGAFGYSAEEGTRAARIRRGKIGAAEIERRRTMLLELQRPIMERRLRRFVGRTVDALVEERVPGTSLALCRGFMHAPEVDGAIVASGCGDAFPGEVIAVRIERVDGADLHGRRG